MDTELAPIVLFVYNRPSHTSRTIECLLKNDLSDKSIIYIYSDASISEEDNNLVESVRNYIRTISGFKKIIIVERECNFGLAKNLVLGISEVINEYGKVIVLEDDILTSEGFLRYMNDALTHYQDNREVMHVSAYMYPVSTYKKGIVFLRMLSCWGWGTWESSWKYFTDNSGELLGKIYSAESIKDFNLGGNADFYEQLQANHLKKINTWAVKWYASWYSKGGLSICPTKSLTKNIGHDGSGTNSIKSAKFDTKLVKHIKLKNIKVKEDISFKRKINNFLGHRNYGLVWRTKEGIRRSIVKILTKIVPELRIIIDNYEGLKNILDFSEYNNISPTARIDPPARIYNTRIGDYSYLSVNSRVSETVIGKYCSIGPNFLCGWGIHPVDGISTSPIFYRSSKSEYVYSKTNKVEERKPVTIGNDVFIGMNVTILDGVSIGNGAVIGAGAVVATDIPDYAIAVGVPAKPIKYRFDKSQIKDLLKIEWWNMNEDQLYKVEKYFFEVDDFIREIKFDRT